jgi:hypothetical protein
MPKPTFFLRVKTQFGNLGDALINRELIRLLASHGSLVINLSAAPPRFRVWIDEGIPDAAIRTGAVGYWLRLIWRLMRRPLGSGDLWVVLNPGGYVGEVGRIAMIGKLLGGLRLRILRSLGCKAPPGLKPIVGQEVVLLLDNHKIGPASCRPEILQQKPCAKEPQLSQRHVGCPRQGHGIAFPKIGIGTGVDEVINHIVLRQPLAKLLVKRRPKAQRCRKGIDDVSACRCLWRACHARSFAGLRWANLSMSLQQDTTPS